MPVVKETNLGLEHVLVAWSSKGVAFHRFYSGRAALEAGEWLEKRGFKTLAVEDEPASYEVSK